MFCDYRSPGDLAGSSWTSPPLPLTSRMSSDSKLYANLAALFVLIAIPTCAVGLMRFDSNMEDVFQWLPDSSTEREIYDEFVEQFGSDDFVVVTWPGCTLSDPRTDAFVAKLSTESARQFIKESISGTQLLRRLEERGLDREAVLQRFRGVYFSPQGNRTCVVVSLSGAGMAARKEAIGLIRRTGTEVLGSQSDRMLIGGYPQVGAFGDEAS